jgi:soluble lytic murein transglycosylase
MADMLRLRSRTTAFFSAAGPLALCLAVATTAFAAPPRGPASGLPELVPSGRAQGTAILPVAATEDTASSRVPRSRPQPEALDVSQREPRTYYGFDPDPQLAAALDALGRGRYAEARALAAEHADPLVPQLIQWMIAREPDSGLTAAQMIAAMGQFADWPEPERLALRAEQAFHATGPDPASVVIFYSLTPPRTIGGKLALAAGLREAGRDEEARAIISALWREETLSPGQSAALITRFGASLTRDDHLYRFRRLVLNSRTADSVAQAKLVGAGYEDLARAVTAVIDRRSDGPKKLQGVAARFSSDPLYVFARIRDLRRNDKVMEAARLLLRSEADSKLAGDPDIWWDERRDLSRELLDLGEADLAYKVASQHQALGGAERAEAAFHCGWFALRFLEDPARALPYFRELTELATLPRTRARAAYWLGRTYEAQGSGEAARLAFVDAARFGGTFYGQLAREKLGLTTTGLERIPAPSALDRIRFADRIGVRAIKLLAAAGHADRAFPFFQKLAVSTQSAGEITLLNELARRIEQPRAGLIAATAAEKRGLPVSSLTAPFLAVPTGLPMPESVDRALVYSIVRQESAFNHQATSHVGARGLMQLMPATAKETARSAGLPFSVQRLTSDPVYNATLGAEYLGGLMDRLNSSYVLTFVGYNAGPGRAFQWVKRYGDPRGGAVDVVDWIERIPFDETRNYVQKVMENLQSYRSRIGHPLSLSTDLIRGGPQG